MSFGQFKAPAALFNAASQRSMSFGQFKAPAALFNAASQRSMPFRAVQCACGARREATLSSESPLLNRAIGAFSTFSTAQRASQPRHRRLSARPAGALS